MKALTPAIEFHSGDCQGVARVLARIGDKWSVLVIMMLSEKPLRFNEMRRLIAGISQRMLTLTLRGLERDGLVTRHLTPIIPPRVDYQLTDLGRSLCVPVVALGEWARQHGTEMERAQTLFDRGKAAASAPLARNAGQRPTSTVLVGHAKDRQPRSIVAKVKRQTPHARHADGAETQS